MLMNATRFVAEAVPYQDERGRDVVVLLAKATFLNRNGVLVPSDEQVPVRTNDVLENEAAVEGGGESSIRYPSDVGGTKAGVDIVVVGDAVSRKPVRSVDVAVRAMGRTVALRVHGERIFCKSAMGVSMTPAVAFEHAAITYERAYGGRSKDASVVDWRNPAGRGVYGSVVELDMQPAPSIEDPSAPYQPGQRGIPVGFGAIASWWEPRRRYAGTADERWQVERMPLPALDFDPNHYRVAHPRLQFDGTISPGESISTYGMSVDGLFDVTVPNVQFMAHVHRNRVPQTRSSLTLDTILIEPERRRAQFTYRRVIALGRGNTLLREVRLDVDS